MKFALPFILSDFLQQLYNLADSIIIGRYLGNVALAGIGVATPIMSIVINFLSGLAMGTGVVLSQYFGKGDNKSLRRVMSTGIISGGFFTLALSGACIGLSRLFLIGLATPQEAIAPADLYLKIIFAGAIFTFMYNYCLFSLRAVGNSFAPLVFLCLSVVINAVLDIVLVIYTPMGIAGAAIATVAAQAVSVVMCLVYIYHKVPLLHIGHKDWIFDKKLFPKVMSYGLTVGFQQVVIYAGRIAVQGLVNTYGTDVMAGVNNATRLDALMQTPVRGYTNALTNYYAQNWGAAKKRRIMLGYRGSLAAAVFNTVFFVIAGTFLAMPLSLLFVAEGESNVVAEVSARFLQVMVYGYLPVGIILLSQALFKGVGKIGFFLTTTVSSIIMRVVFSYLLAHFYGLEGMYAAVPVSWAVAAVVGLVLTVFTYFGRIRKMPGPDYGEGERTYNAFICGD